MLQEFELQAHRPVMAEGAVQVPGCGVRRIWGAMRAWAASISARVDGHGEPRGFCRSVQMATGRPWRRGRAGRERIVLHLSRDRAPRSTPQAHRAGRPAPRPAAGRCDQVVGRKAGPAQQRAAQVHARPVGRALHLLRLRQRPAAVQRPEGKFGMHLVDARQQVGPARAAARRSRGSWGRWQSPAARPCAAVRGGEREVAGLAIIGGLDRAARGNGEDGGLPRAEKRAGSAAPARAREPSVRSGSPMGMSTAIIAGRSGASAMAARDERRHDAVDLRIVHSA